MTMNLMFTENGIINLDVIAYISPGADKPETHTALIFPAGTVTIAQPFLEVRELIARMVKEKYQWELSSKGAVLDRVEQIVGKR